MTVHHIINSYSNQAGGAEKLVRSLHESLRDAGYQSAILGIEAHPGAEEDGAVSLRLRSPYNLLAPWKLLAYLRRNVEPTDIVHAHLFPSILYVSLFKQLGLFAGPLVMTEHSTSNSRRNSLFGKLADRFLYRGYDRIYAISEGVASELKRWQPHLAQRIKVVPNGVKQPFKEPLVRPATACPIVLSVGHLRKAKNYEKMLHAVAEIGASDFEYWIAGTGKDEACLAELAVALGIDTKVTFLGPVADIQPLLQRADIFLMASKWEGFGMAAIEAMNASLPLVVSDVPGLRDAVAADQPCAIMVYHDSVSSIAGGLKKMLASAEMRRLLGANGFKRAKHFTVDQMMRSYRREYDALHQH